MSTTNTTQKFVGGLIGLAALFAILVAGNYVINQAKPMKVDLTEGKLYTLSAGTKTVLGKLDNEVTLMYFYSSSMNEVPSYLKTFAKDTEDLLKEYVAASGGKIKLEKYDPAPDSDAEETAQKYGISGQPMDVFGPPFYIGLAARMGNEEASLPALDPNGEKVLEYDITRLINRVAHPEKPVIGVMGSLPVMGVNMPQQFNMPGQPNRNQPAWILFQQLMQDYKLKDLPMTTEEIPADVKLLIVVHPKDVSDKALFAIDQFVLRGGRLIAFVDPLCLIDSPNPYESMMGGGQKSSSTLGKLFTAWGVTFDTTKVIADMKSATRIQGERGVEDTPVWLSLGTNALNRSDIVTVQLNAMMLPLAGAFHAESTKEMTVTPLITSSDAAGPIDGMMAQMGGQMMRSSVKSAGTPFDLAIRMKGKFKTAFPEGRPLDEKEQANAATNAVKEAAQVKGLQSGESAVILVGDVDFIYDPFCIDTREFLGAKQYEPKNDNSRFLFNAVENLSGSTDLMAVRSRGQIFRPYQVVLDKHIQATVKWQEEEKQLNEELKKTQERLQELQVSKDKNQRSILSQKQKNLIADFRQKELEIKKKLRNVRKELRRDIENLALKVKLINIGAMPLLVGLIGLSFGLYRQRRNRE